MIHFKKRWSNIAPPRVSEAVVRVRQWTVPGHWTHKSNRLKESDQAKNGRRQIRQPGVGSQYRAQAGRERQPATQPDKDRPHSRTRTGHSAGLEPATQPGEDRPHSRARAGHTAGQARPTDTSLDHTGRSISQSSARRIGHPSPN